MSHYKRKKSRKNVRCRICTDNRDYAGGERLYRKKQWKKQVEADLRNHE
jgi:hypothetical protein